MKLFTSLCAIVLASSVVFVYGAKTEYSEISLFLQKNLPQLEFLRPLGSLFLSDKCFDSLVLHYELTDVECIKEGVSKGLSYGIIVFSSVLKLPLIFNILKNKSVEGLSPTSTYLETTMYTGNFIYNFLAGSPITTYAELFTLALQNVGIILCIWTYSTVSLLHTATVALCFAGFISIALNLEQQYWWMLSVYGIAITCLSRLPQIYANFRDKHTGVLSQASTGMSVAGGSVRLGILFKEVDDMNAIFPVIVGVSLQIIILLQILSYKENTKKVMAAAAKKKNQ